MSPKSIHLDIHFWNVFVFYVPLDSISVCMPVKIQVDSKQNKTLFSRSWKMGSCTGPTGRTKYTSIGTYIDRCCLPPGSYTLACKNDKGPFGWGNSFIEIQGMRYCNNFFGSETFRRVLIKGKYLISRYNYTYKLAIITIV